MIEQSETRIVVRDTIDATATELFSVLADPRQHTGIDGSGMLRADVDTRPISAVGQVFTMEMHYPALGDYRTDNHVVEFEPDRRVAWTTAREGQRPAGVKWRWQLQPVGSQRTTVEHTYDWSAVTNPAVLPRVRFPRVSPAALEQSVVNLAAIATAARD